ncbi:NADPH-dependent F420 reductase [Pararhizobium gei]|uniref:NADPH-dependent F420 reductase n=1 Tax=Pararhizobium gei TaxID=1395951 RepID=UPI0023DA3364|nr:NAD(P)-binding domain-containing protein [Rhizobium gei]
MKIGIIGVGNIGKTIAQRLSAAGHHVKVANSRGPETIEADVLSSGARAVTVQDAATDVEALILSIPLNRIGDIASLVSSLPAETVVIDTSNYYPMRDGKIEELEQGKVESVWVSEHLGRPIVKAWNAIGTYSFAHKNKPEGHTDRIAIPVAADDDRDRKVGMALVEATGFTAFDAGAISESWRQQPGSPAYCTDLTRDEIPDALAAAEKTRLPKRRDLAAAAFQERLESGQTGPFGDYLVNLNRAIYR